MVVEMFRRILGLIWQSKKARFGWVATFLLLSTTVLRANEALGQAPVFIHAACYGKISTSVISSFREEVRASKKYRLVPTVDDDGRMDLVLMVYVNCTESPSVSAIAFAFGQGKCTSTKNCHLALEAESIRSALCESSASVDCGRALFKAFDDYMSNPTRHAPKAN